ncbi:LpxI family protein [Aureimonas sp. AU12]|uniref:LpxI family protein n=1 Tax=Aureimonas sp. AU12 TaxID=1638161 RepID=UPI00244E9245|nr:UDP-2,3-diacylglucosamine diphosphatase LpxI [Aureimonas sp. AU12]
MPTERPVATPSGRLAIIAGGGALPRIVADEAARAGRNPFIVPIADGRAGDWSAWDHKPLSWARTGDVFALLRSRGVGTVVFCGTISVRPDYRSMIPSLRTLAFMPELFRMVRGGDDSLIRAVSRAFEARGFEVVGVQSIVPTLLMPAGVLSARTPDLREMDAVRRAAEAADLIGRLDVGQAVVASCDRVIALEGIEGTQEMLRRVADLRARGRIGRREPTVLFKAFKPQQDARFDLPSMGRDTVDQAVAAGLSGIALTAGRSLLIESERVLEAMSATDLFLVGMETHSESAA